MMTNDLCATTPAAPVAVGADRLHELVDHMAGMAGMETAYLRSVASMTASENFSSSIVRLVGGLRGGSTYYFDPPDNQDPGEWSFPNSGFAPEMQREFQSLVRQLFGAEIADWRPNGGSVCELAVMLAVCGRGDALMHFSHDQGGHFAVETVAQAAGIEVLHFPMHDRDCLVDVDRTQAILEREPRVRLLLLDQSHALRAQDVHALRSAVGDDVVISYDASHLAGLIAGGQIAQPLAQGADVLHANTHKTLPGPQKALVGFRDAGHPAAQGVFDWICPGLQSNSHAEWLPSMVLTLAEAATWGRAYAEQVTENAKALARTLADEGVRVAGESFGFTETHQVHVVVGDERRSHHLANEVLHACGIRVNSVVIPGTGGRFGLRLGTQAMTRRGLREADFAELARLLAKGTRDPEHATAVRAEVGELVSAFPLFPLAFSLDLLDDAALSSFVAEVLR